MCGSRNLSEDSSLVQLLPLCFCSYDDMSFMHSARKERQHFRRKVHISGKTYWRDFFFPLRKETEKHYFRDRTKSLRLQARHTPTRERASLLRRATSTRGSTRLCLHKGLRFTRDPQKP